MMKIALVALVAPVFSDDQIVVNWQKLTDFTTQYEINVVNAANPPSRYQRKALNVTASITGTINLDVKGEEVSVTAKGSLAFGKRDDGPYPKQIQTGNTSDPDPNHQSWATITEFLPGFKVSGNGAFAFSRSKGGGSVKAAAATNDYHGFRASSDFCVSVHVPVGILPPGGALMSMIGSKESQVSQALNRMPHEKVDYDGISVAKFVAPRHNPRWSQRTVFFEIEFDGTPVRFESDEPATYTKCEGECQYCNDHPCRSYEDYDENCCEKVIYGSDMSVSAEFKDWTEGAGEVDTFECAEGLSTDLEAHPEALLPMLAFEHLVKHLPKEAFPTLPFPAEPVELLFSATEEANAQTLATAPAPQAWPMTMACAGGALGAAVVLGMASIVQKKRRSEPLLA